MGKETIKTTCVDSISMKVRINPPITLNRQWVKLSRKIISISLALIMPMLASPVMAIETYVITGLQASNGGGTNTGIKLSGPADSQQYGQRIGISAPPPGVNLYICSSNTLNYNLAKIELVPDMVWSGISVPNETTGGTDALFNTNIPGLNIIPMIVRPNMSLGYSRYIAVGPESRIYWQGNTLNADRIKPDPSRYLLPQFAVYKNTARLEPGATSISAGSLYHFNCIDDKEQIQEVYRMDMMSTTVILDMKTCTPMITSTQVNMPPLPVGALSKSSTALLNPKTVNFTLYCDKDLSVFYAITDILNPANTSTISTLGDGSTATGVGYQVTVAGGSPLEFGPDGSAKDIPGQKQYLWQKVPTSDTPGRVMVTLPLTFSYVRDTTTTSPLKTGTAKSMIGLIYSYQ